MRCKEKTPTRHPFPSSILEDHPPLPGELMLMSGLGEICVETSYLDKDYVAIRDSSLGSVEQHFEI